MKVILGLSLISYGFYSWYRHHQKQREAELLGPKVPDQIFAGLNSLPLPSLNSNIWSGTVAIPPVGMNIRPAGA